MDEQRIFVQFIRIRNKNMDLKINMLYLGTSGWYYEHWIDQFYPSDLSKSDWLSFYADRFNTVEVNASFYRLLFKNMIKGWKNKTPDDFLLTFKGSQLITHKKKLQDVEEYLNRFHQRIRLAKKIGVVLWQLPPSLKKDIDRLESFLQLLDSDMRHCVEFRHKSWFDDGVFDLLRRYNIGFCILSAPKLPSMVQVTSDFAYIRWHGVNDWYQHDYTDVELKEWAETINSFDVDTVFGYFNNDYQGFAPKNCLTLKKILS